MLAQADTDTDTYRYIIAWLGQFDGSGIPGEPHISAVTIPLAQPLQESHTGPAELFGWLGQSRRDSLGQIQTQNNYPSSRIMVICTFAYLKWLNYL